MKAVQLLFVFASLMLGVGIARADDSSACKEYRFDKATVTTHGSVNVATLAAVVAPCEGTMRIYAYAHGDTRDINAHDPSDRYASLKVSVNGVEYCNIHDRKFDDYNLPCEKTFAVQGGSQLDVVSERENASARENGFVFYVYFVPALTPRAALGLPPPASKPSK